MNCEHAARRCGDLPACPSAREGRLPKRARRARGGYSSSGRALLAAMQCMVNAAMQWGKHRLALTVRRAEAKLDARQKRPPIVPSGHDERKPAKEHVLPASHGAAQPRRAAVSVAWVHARRRSAPFSTRRQSTRVACALRVQARTNA